MPRLDDDSTEFTVVVNLVGQYSIWPVGLQTPEGWTEVGKRGTKAECLDFIGTEWTDMRPSNTLPPTDVSPS